MASRMEQLLSAIANGEAVNFEPRTRNEALLKKIMQNGGGSGGGAQSDWNAAEGEPGHILNRPFYDAVENAVVLPETIPQFVEEYGGFAVPDVIPLIDGKQYTVKWNGVDYVTTAIYMDGVLAMGNMGAMQEGYPVSDDPFVIIAFDPNLAEQNGVGVLIVPLDGSESITLSITGPARVIKTIPVNLLPRYTIVLAKDEEVETSDGTQYITSSANYDDFAELVYNGAEVWVDITEMLNNASPSVETWMHCRVNGWWWNKSTKVFSVTFATNFGLYVIHFPNGTWTPPGYVAE